MNSQLLIWGNAIVVSFCRGFISGMLFVFIFILSFASAELMIFADMYNFFVAGLKANGVSGISWIVFRSLGFVICFFMLAHLNVITLTFECNIIF